MAAARRAGAAQEAGLHRRGDRGAGGVRRLARPRPGHPRRGATTASRADRRGARGGDRPRRPDLPDQLHGLPQLRRLRRRLPAAATPRALTASSRKHIYEAMLTGPQADADLLRRQPDARGQARHHRLPRQSLEDTPEVRRLRPRRPRPGAPRACSPGSSASARCVGFAVWIAAHTARSSQEEGGRVSDHDDQPCPTTGTSDRTPDAVARADRRPRAARARAGGRPTSTRSAEKRAERQVAALFGAVRGLHGAVRASPTSPSTIGDDPDDRRRLRRLQPRPRPDPRPARCCSSASASIQWARKLMADHEIVEDRHPAALLRRGPRRGRSPRFNQGVEESGIGRRPLIRNSCSARSACSACPSIVLLRDLGPLAGRRSSAAHGLDARACGSSATSPAPRSAVRHARSASWSTPSPRRFFERATRTASRASRASSSRTPSPRPR